MTTKTVHTLTAAERDYLQAAVQCFLAVQAETMAFGASPGKKGLFAAETELYALGLLPLRNVSPLDHEQAAELLCLLGDAADVELHVPADPVIDDEPMGLEAAFVESASAAHRRI